MGQAGTDPASPLPSQTRPDSQGAHCLACPIVGKDVLSCQHLFYAHFPGRAPSGPARLSASEKYGLTELLCHLWALWPRLSITGSGEIWTPEPVGWREPFPNGLSCCSVSAKSVARTALCPCTFPAPPLEEEPHGDWGSCWAWETAPVVRGPAMDRWTDRTLTVRASITSWKFLFPAILFFIARKASLGLSRETEEGQAEAYDLLI